MSQHWSTYFLWASWLVFLIFLLVRQESAITQDLGRHLRLGEMIVTNNPPGARACALFRNCLTFTHPDYPFVNHHWGSEIIFYLIYKLGRLPALIIFKSLILAAAFAITVRHATASKGPTLSNSRSDLNKLAFAATLTFFSIQIMADRLTTRPEIFGYLLFSLLFWLLNSPFISTRSYLYLFGLIPLIILIWVNLHISFIFGLIIIWLWAGCQAFKGSTPTPRRGRTLILPIASTLATLANPAGLRGALMPLTILKDYGYTIVENMTPFFLRTFKPQPEYWIYSILLVAVTILIIASPRKPSLFSISTFYLFSVFPLVAVRHLPFFGLAAPIALAPLLAGQDGKFAKFPSAVAFGLILLALSNPTPLADGKLPPTGLGVDTRYDAAAKFVKQNPFVGRMWNNYDVGSFLEWAIPEHPTFVDGRPEAFPVGFFQQTYIPMQQNLSMWDKLTAEHDIQWVFAAITDATPWFRSWWQMIKQHPDWKIVYLDKSSTILIKTGGANQQIEPVGLAKSLDFLGNPY